MMVFLIIAAIWAFCLLLTYLFKRFHIILYKIENDNSYYWFYDTFDLTMLMILTGILGPLMAFYWLYVTIKFLGMIYFKSSGSNIEKSVEHLVRKWISND